MCVCVCVCVCVYIPERAEQPAQEQPGTVVVGTGVCARAGAGVEVSLLIPTRTYPYSTRTHPYRTRTNPYLPVQYLLAASASSARVIA